MAVNVKLPRRFASRGPRLKPLRSREANSVYLHACGGPCNVLCGLPDEGGTTERSAIDTVERFQGSERAVILVSATESDRGYVLASSDFLLDPRRLTVALSRAKRKTILVASLEHLLGLQPRRGCVRQLTALEELAAADLHDAAMVRREGWQVGGGMGMS